MKKELKEVMEERDEHERRAPNLVLGNAPERRAPNLVLGNIPESNREHVDDRKKEDENLLRETLKKTEFSVEELNEATINARLGRVTTNDSIRSIKIKINSPLTKAKFLMNGRLINSRDCPAADIIIIC